MPGVQWDPWGHLLRGTPSGTGAGSCRLEAGRPDSLISGLTASSSRSPLKDRDSFSVISRLRLPQSNVDAGGLFRVSPG